LLVGMLAIAIFGAHKSWRRGHYPAHLFSFFRRRDTTYYKVKRRVSI
jgi:hypothetical protein